MPVSSATSPSHRPSSDTDTITFPWLRIVGGGGTGSARVGVSIPLDSGVGAELAVAETAVANAELLLTQTRAQAALELQAAQNQLATTENSLAAGRALVVQRELSLETTRTRLGLGLVPALEVERAEAELLAARVERGRLEDNALLARLILLQTLAISPLEVF